MREVPVQTHCNLCGSEQYTLVYRQKKESIQAADADIFSDKPEKVVRCLVCKVVYAIPKNTGKQQDVLYADLSISAANLEEEKGLRSRAGLLLAKIGKYKRRGKMLEIGSGPGFLLEEARKLGWEVQGVDLSMRAREYCQKRFSIPVFKGSVEEAGFRERNFDVIVINDVLAQMKDPKTVLQEARRILANDGILYMSTPDIGSFWSRFLESRWWGIHNRHFFYFSKKTLESFFSVIGFKPLRYFSYPRVFSLRYWVMRLGVYPAWVRWPFEFLSGISNWGDKELAIVLHDQIGVLAKKIHRLDSVIADEPKKEMPVRKQKVVVVLPAYNAEKTLERTVADIPRNCVDEIILVDDCSKDRTVEVAKKIGITVFVHKTNRGYGGNQKTCYAKAIERGADVAVMCHPDYQYDPKIIPQLIDPILRGQADAVFGSRMMKGGALEGGMPLWKHNANILLTAFENVILGTYLTEFHSGFRAYSTRLLKTIDFEANSDNFVFDTEIIVQILVNHFKIEEVPIRTRYFEEASSIKLGPSIAYGLGILRVMFGYVLYSNGWTKNKKYEPHPRDK